MNWEGSLVRSLKSASKTINAAAVNAFVLAKHHLTTGSRSSSVPRVVADIIGLHATAAATPYLSLFARMKHFTRDMLYTELYVKRSLAKVRCMRKTVFVLPRNILAEALVATRAMTELVSTQYSRYLGMSEEQYQETAGKVLQILKGRTMSSSEIKKELALKLNVSAITNLMCDQAKLIRASPQGGWRSNAHTYALFSEWFPDINLLTIRETEARAAMVKRYVRAFGPVTESDVSWWTGFPMREVRHTLDGEDVTPVQIDNLDQEFYMSSDQVQVMNSTDPPDKNEVMFLPTLDPYPMGYRDRGRYLNTSYRDYVFDGSGNATSTIVVDGRITGVWDIEDSTVKVFLFETAEDRLRDLVQSEARRTGSFVAERKADVEECHSMVPLPRRTAGGVMSPLRSPSQN